MRTPCHEKARSKPSSYPASNKEKRIVIDPPNTIKAACCTPAHEEQSLGVAFDHHAGYQQAKQALTRREALTTTTAAGPAITVWSLEQVEHNLEQQVGGKDATSPPRKSECPGGAGQIAKKGENAVIFPPDAGVCKTAMGSAGGDRK